MPSLRVIMKRLTSVILALSASAVHGRAEQPFADISARLTSYLQRRSDGSTFSGVAYVRQHEKTLVRAGFGKADIELDVPNTPELIYRIGSLTKPFTAIAVMSL